MKCVRVSFFYYYLLARFLFFKTVAGGLKQAEKTKMFHLISERASCSESEHGSLGGKEVVSPENEKLSVSKQSELYGFRH